MDRFSPDNFSTLQIKGHVLHGARLLSGRVDQTRESGGNRAYLSLHQGSTESRKTLEQKFIFQIGTLNPHGINEPTNQLSTNSSSINQLIN